jgi:N-methylhydantoinase B
MQRGLRLVGPEATYSVLADGAVLPAFGILGGGSGVPVESHVLRDGRVLPFPTPGKVGGFRLQRDDVLVLQSAGGGGYGDPLERSADLVALDLREGYISAARCRDRYGVIVRENGSVDDAATEARRRQLAGARVRLRVVDSAEALYAPTSVSRRRICPLSPADAARAGVGAGAIVELVGPRVPLRAWVVLHPAVASGTVPVDAPGRQILGVDAGQPLQIRPL